MRVAIVGAGMAGLSCAEALAAAAGMAAEVVLFDKGRAPGGRMSTRRMSTTAGEAAFDHGAQYFTARDPAFRARVARWAETGIAAPWPAAGHDSWVGTPSMNAPVKAMAAGHDVRWSVAVDRLDRDGEGDGESWRVNGEPFGTVLLAIPAEQAAPLLRPWQAAFADTAARTPAAPCWTLMAAFAAPVPFAADVMREAGIIGWAARNSAKPGRTGPESWVVQAGPDWSRAELERRPEEVVAPLLEAFAARVGASLPPVLTTAAHRWRFARSGKAGPAALWDPALRLGVCGDWLLGPRVEAAWLSGTELAALMLPLMR